MSWVFIQDLIRRERKALTFTPGKSLFSLGGCVKCATQLYNHQPTMTEKLLTGGDGRTASI